MIKTISIILEQSFLYFPLVLGSYFGISLMKVPDLSIECAYVFGAILGSKQLIMLRRLPTTVSILPTIIAALVGGVVVGLCSSILTQKAKIPHLISSIATIGIFHGINQFVLGNPSISLNQQQNILETNTLEFLKKNPEFLMLSLIFLILFFAGKLFLKTELGCSLAVYGNNPHFFENHSISTPFVFISGIIIANALAGLSGLLIALSNGFADINMGFGIALFCITALILGKAFVLRRKTISILIPILGSISYFSIQQLLLKVGFNLKYFTMIQAFLILGILIHKTYKEQGNKNNEKIDNLGV